MTIVRRLFVGGQKHGQMLDVDSDALAWRVPTAYEGAYTDALYCRYRFIMQAAEEPARIVSLMACWGSPAEAQVRDAMVIAWMREHGSCA